MVLVALFISEIVLKSVHVQITDLSNKASKGHMLAGTFSFFHH
jgi:hypothetical protein